MTPQDPSQDRQLGPARFLLVAGPEVGLVTINPILNRASQIVLVRSGAPSAFGENRVDVSRCGHNGVLQKSVQGKAMITQNPWLREGPLLGSYVKAMLEVTELDSQIARLKTELAATYQHRKLSSINPVDLEAERKNTKRCLERLAVKRKAMLEAHAQNAKRAWTEHGDFSNVLHTGVILNGN